MRIGLLIYGSLETLSGGYLYDRQLVQYLRTQGDQVEVISLPWRNYARHLLDNGSVALARQLQQLELDVLIQDELNHASLAWINRRIKGHLDFPLVTLVHHLRCDERRPAWQNRFYGAVERRYLTSVDAFIFNSQTTRRAVERVLGRPLQRPAVIATPGGDRWGAWNGPDPAALSLIQARARQPGPLRLLFLGNLIERKGLHTLLAALARLPGGAWRLQIVGSEQADPGYARRMREQTAALGLQNWVEFSGVLADAALLECLRNSQALVAPSSYEGFGIVYLEALHFGLAVIGGTHGAAGEIITPGEQGFLVDPEDSAGLAQYLARWLEDRPLLARMSVAAYRRAGEFPGWQASMAGVRAFLAALVTAA